MTDITHDMARDSEPPQEAVPAAPRNPGFFSDPVVKWLVALLALMVIGFLATVLAALFLGILGDDTPRTAVERDLKAYEFQTQGGSKDPEAWRKYVAALIETGQLTKAQQVVDQGIKVIDNRPGADMTLAQALIFFEDKEYSKTVATASKGMSALSAYYKKQKSDKQNPEAHGQEISENYWKLLFLRAAAYTKLGQDDKAIKDYDEYLKARKGAADVLVLRGNARAKTGDKKGAEEDYRAALKFIADYQAAKEGLKKLGVEE